MNLLSYPCGPANAALESSLLRMTFVFQNHRRCVSLLKISERTTRHGLQSSRSLIKSWHQNSRDVLVKWLLYPYFSTYPVLHKLIYGGQNCLPNKNLEISYPINIYIYLPKVADRYVVHPSMKLRFPDITVTPMPSPIIIRFHFFFLISTFSL